ncbi:hypothetical protein [uncultured Albimonas sp.]|uniref:hypothetical protein n=1 Tax=uncultured Albimonas sp. TaxID=1331701 RepID=UPI0030EC5435|tara:strand:- start:3672 stop:4517 length:846 start_codon:yes stop_codon:yes gene_type:complete
MGLIADGLLIAAALTAAIYCHVLAGRLRSLRRLDGGVGQAVATMASQTDELRQALRAARAAAGESTRTLSERTARAEMAAGRLELLLAAIHDNQGGAAPANVAARREARQAAAFSSRPRPQVVGGTGAAAARAAEPFDAAAAVAALRSREAAPEDDEDLDDGEDESVEVGFLDADPDADAGAAATSDERDADDLADNESADADDSADAGDSARPAAVRRLFRIEVDPAAEPDAAAETESVQRTARGAPRARPPRGRGLADSSDGTEALRAAIEALARESGE